MHRTQARCALPQVREIEEVHVSDLSVEMFEELYAYSHRPLVVRNASIFWDALQVDLIMHNDISIVQCKLGCTINNIGDNKGQDLSRKKSTCTLTLRSLTTIG